MLSDDKVILNQILSSIPRLICGCRSKFEFIFFLSMWILAPLRCCQELIRSLKITLIGIFDKDLATCENRLQSIKKNAHPLSQSFEIRKTLKSLNRVP